LKEYKLSAPDIIPILDRKGNPPSGDQKEASMMDLIILLITHLQDLILGLSKHYTDLTSIVHSCLRQPFTAARYEKTVKTAWRFLNRPMLKPL